MKLGYAQTMISPSLERPVYLAGFGKDRIAESIHDDLYARALALTDEKTCIVLCALDLIGFFQNDLVPRLINSKAQDIESTCYIGYRSRCKNFYRRHGYVAVYR